MLRIIQHEAGNFAVVVGTPIDQLLEIGVLRHPVRDRRIDRFRRDLFHAHPR
ncbi:hypothetical protein D3C72_2560440 [compost metagenome]